MQQPKINITEADLIWTARRLSEEMGTRCFIIPEEIGNFAYSLCKDEWVSCHGKAELFRVPLDARLQGSTTLLALTWPGMSGNYVAVLLNPKENKSPQFVAHIKYGDEFVLFGMFEPGEQYHILKPDHLPDIFDRNTAFTWLSLSAFTLSLINQPSLVAKEEVLTRQQRREWARRGIEQDNQLHRVSWDLSRETVARVSRDPSFVKLPLHWRRGHYRRAEPSWRGAIQRPDAIRPEDRDLWWQWIEGTWVGHPAFGVKLSVHAPKLSSGQIAGAA